MIYRGGFDAIGASNELASLAYAGRAIVNEQVRSSCQPSAPDRRFLYGYPVIWWRL